MKFSLIAFTFLSFFAGLSYADPTECSLSLINYKFYYFCSIRFQDLAINKTQLSFDYGVSNISSCNQTDHFVTGVAKNSKGCFDFKGFSGEAVTIGKKEGVLLSSTSSKVDEHEMRLNLTLICSKVNQKNNSMVFNTDGTIEEKGRTTILMSSVHSVGCSVTATNRIVLFFMENKFCAPILVFIGVIYCFLGLRHFNTIIYITTFGATLSFIGIILEQISSVSKSQLIILVALGIIVAGDVFLTYFLKKTKTMGYVLVGTAFGAVNGVLIFDTMISPLIKGDARDIVFSVLVAICSLSCAVIAAWIQKDGFIIFTAFIGAFLIVRPLATLMAGFRAETIDLELFRKTTFWYLIVVLFIASMGIRFQKKYYTYILRDQTVKDEKISFREYTQLF